MDATPESSGPSWEELEAEYHREVGYAPETSAAARLRRRRRRTRNLIEWAVAIVGALAVAWFIQTFLVQAFVIPSASMEPTLVDRDRVLVNKLARNFDRGDVIVFNRPPEIEMGEVDDLIKRVLAVEGEVIEATGGVVHVDGVAIEEPYLEPGAFTEDFAPVEVPDGHLFVMGDNRGHAMSFDSRFFGPIPDDLVVGRAILVVWPFSHFGGL